MQLKTFSTAAISACLTSALMLMGCSPKSYEFSMAQDWRHDKKLQTYVQQLTDEEKELFTAYIVRAEQAGSAEKNAFGMISIGQAIKLQTEWQSQHARKDAAAPQVAQGDESAHIRLVKEIRGVVTPSVMSFKYSNDKSTENWKLGMSFKNNGIQNIIGIQGTIVVSNNQGVELKRSTVQTDTTIQPGAVINKVWHLDYSSKDAGDLALRKADVTKLVFSWYPSTYSFADGTKLTLAK